MSDDASDKPHNMEEIMAAIHKVLADHDVSQARVVLELFDAADERQAAAGRRPPQMQPLPPRTAPSPRSPRVKTEAMILAGPVGCDGDGPMRSPERQSPIPRPRTSSKRCTHMVGDSSGPAPPPGGVSLPPAAKESSSSSTTTTTTGNVPSPRPPPVPRTASPNGPDKDLDATVDQLDHTARPAHNPTTATTATTVARPAPPPAATTTTTRTTTTTGPDGTTTRTTRTSTTSTSATTTTTGAAGGRRLSGFDGNAAPAMADLDPSSLLPQELFERLSQQQSREDRLRILKGFVGTSALLEDKKRRESAAKEQRPHTNINAFLSQCKANANSPNGKRSGSSSDVNSATTLPALSGDGAAGRGKATTTTSTTTTTATHVPTVPSAAGSPPSGGHRRFSSPRPEEAAPSPLKRGGDEGRRGSGAGELPSLPANFGRTFTETCRENAQRAAQLRTGLNSSVLPAGEPTGRNSTSGAGTSLKDMLREQQRLERENQAKLRQHGQVMDEARKYLVHVAETGETGGADAPRRTPPLEHYSSGSSAPAPPGGEADRPSPRRAVTTTSTTTTTTTTSSSTGGRGGAGGTAATPPPLAAAASLRPTTPTATSPQRSTSSRSGSSIQVVRFTMPQERGAKEEVVAQLCRSPAGIQHVSTKDRYAAMLAGQNQIMHDTEDKNKRYQQLLSRAVEFNESLQGGGGSK